ncbi:phenylalanine--tRNA ligase subunit alpha [Halobacteriales archaeon QS_8_69_26]|nr:MAG: phenylalanine--tRNA ligase subunit alpha [Halobacteriales archaeon QS_8_69_26]
MRLPRSQAAVLEAASATDAQSIDTLAEATGLPPETVARAAFELEEEGLVEVEEEEREETVLTDEGSEYAEDGLPEVRLYRAAVAAGADEAPVPMGEVVGAADLGDRTQIALANYGRKGYGSVESGEITADPDADPDADAEATALDVLADDEADVDEGTPDRLERRDLVERHSSTVRRVRLTDEGVTALMEGIETVETATELTPGMLASGEWRDVEFGEYNVEADAPSVTGGKVHPLRGMIERVKEVLVGMGFQEMDGPHADADFWINDCLFMPQDHPARTHWGRFALDHPSHIDDLPEDLVDRVERAHREGVGEDGEGYHSPWDEDFARALALRGHTTSLSARYLSGHQIGDLEPPQRFFSIEKAYRNDELDATHLLEFFQIEGWVMAEDLSIRDMMGTFEELYAQFGITDLEYKPTYNPYTEPSFELFGEHPETGEVIEVGNSGIFRPEMLEPLGVDCDVMAWGLAGERLMMLTTGAEDIRDVHGTLVDLDYLRNEEVIR